MCYAGLFDTGEGPLGAFRAATGLSTQFSLQAPKRLRSPERLTVKRSGPPFAAAARRGWLCSQSARVHNQQVVKFEQNFALSKCFC